MNKGIKKQFQNRTANEKEIEKMLLPLRSRVKGEQI